MEAIALYFTKFYDEILGAQLALLFISLSLGIYWMLIRKKKRETSDWVPAALVRAYLDRMRADERETRLKLFGEDSGAHAPITATAATSVIPQQIVVSGGDPALAKEIEALRAQLLSADQRSLEFDRQMNGLRAEKTALEEKLKAAASAPAASAGGGGVDPSALAAMKKELDDAKAKLQEYEVIEDDLANLKKFQKENEQLKQKVEQYEKGGASVQVISGDAPAATSSTTISGVTEKIDTPVTVVSGGSAAAPSTSVSGSDTNMLKAADVPPVEAPTPAAAAPQAEAPAEKGAKQKEDELLSEFEKMLAS